MGQMLLIPREEVPQTLNLPPIEVGPISHALGQIRHVMRPAETVLVIDVTEVQVSPRVKEPLYLFGNGERVVVTSRRQVARPAEADGVLQDQGDGTYRWLTHRIEEAFLEDVDRRGWPAVAAEVASRWNDQLSFKAERPNPDGTVSEGNEGLRPPQLVVRF